MIISVHVILHLFIYYFRFLPGRFNLTLVMSVATQRQKEISPLMQKTEENKRHDDHN